jgi:hypothetical protein
VDMTSPEVSVDDTRAAAQLRFQRYIV